MSTDRFQNLIESIPISIAFLDMEGRIRYANRDFRRGFGKKPEELTGQPWDQVMTGEMVRCLKAPVEKALAGLEGDTEATFLFPDGITRDLQISLIPHKEAGAQDGVFCLARDVTRFNIQEQARRQLSARFQALFDKGAMAILIFDLAGHIISANPAMSSLLGYDVDELIGIDFTGLTDTADREKELSLLDELRTKTRDSFQMEKRLLRKDGSTCWVAWSCGMVFDDGGSPWFGMGVAQDVTERHVVRDTLRRRDAILKAVAFAAESLLLPGNTALAMRSVLENFGEATGVQRVAVHDLQSGDSQCRNRLVAEWVDPDARSPDQVTGLNRTSSLADKHWAEIIAPETGRLAAGLPLFGNSRDLAGEQRTSMLAAGVLTWTVIPVLIDGQLAGIMTIEDHLEPRTWHGSELNALAVAAGLIGAARQRSAMEETLRASEERLKLAVEGSNDGVFDWDLDRDLTYFSPRLQEIFGVELADDTIDSPRILKALHPDDRQRRMDELSKYLRSESTTHVSEYRVIRPDGAIVWVLSRGLAIRDRQGVVRRMTGFVTDISERKAMEAALRKAHEEAEKASEAKTRFLASASHDLRQPLQSLTLLIAVLADRTKDPESLDLVRMIDGAVTGVNDLLSGMLDISKLDAGLVKASCEIFDLGELIGRIRADFVVEAQVKGVPVLTRRRPMMVNSDPALVGRILRNLVANAVRYTEEGPGILIAMRKRGQNARVEVWDSGPGIPEDRYEEIFEEFRQLGNPQRDRSRGIGLGLAIVRRLARLLDIPVEVKSRPGHGTRFAIEIPLVDKPLRQQHLPPPPPVADLKNRLIFLVDDDGEVLTALNLLMQSWGCRTVTAQSADEALANLQDLPDLPDLFMIDYRLPDGWTGVLLLQDIRAIIEAKSRGAIIPAIILTGDTAPEQLKDVRNSGASLLHKPVSPDLLRQILSAALQNPAPNSP